MDRNEFLRDRPGNVEFFDDIFRRPSMSTPEVLAVQTEVVVDPAIEVIAQATEEITGIKKG
jgi:hypothetical protein